MGKKPRGPRRGPPRETGRARPVPKIPGTDEGGTRSRGSQALRAVAVALILVAIAVAVFLFRAGTGPDVKRGDGLNLVLITLDTTRADHLGCYGYQRARTPNLDELARKGVRFENAYCSVPLTLPSHASILTGLEPYHHGVHNNGTYVLSPDKVTLAERLKERGYQTASFTASFSVDSRFGLDQGFDVYDDNFQAGSPFKRVDAERRAEQVFTLFSSWLEKKGDGRFFAWVHYYDPHLPYNPPAEYLRDFADRPYDGEIAYMDKYVGEVVRSLREKGLLGKTLVVVVGDHGEGLGEKVERGHGVFIYEAAVRVPLLFYSESSLPSGLVLGATARTIDLVPTILDILGTESVDLDGKSLVPVIEGKGGAGRDVYLESFYPRESWGWSELVGLISDGWKYIQAPRPELYQLARDPGEQTDVARDDPVKAAEMKGRLERTLMSASAAGAGKRELSSSEQERLSSLGYVQFAGSGGKGLPDPKDRLQDLRLYQQAVDFETAGNFPEMERVYRELVTSYPDVASMYINLALAQGMQKKLRQAVETLGNGLEAVPGSEVLRIRLGHAYFVMGAFPEALDVMRQVLASDPNSLDALAVSAMIYESSRRFEDALGCLERSLAIEPENAALRMARARILGLSGRPDDAIAAFSTLVRDYPGEGVYYQYLGVAYAFKQEYERAVENLEQAARLRPSPAVYHQLAVCYRKMGRISEAILSLEKFLEHPGDEDAALIREAKAELERMRARAR